MHANALQKLFVRFVRVIALVAFTVLPTHLLAQPGLGSIESVGWNNTGTKVAVGYNTGLVEVIDSSTGQLLQSFQLPSIVEVDWSPHDSDLLAVSAAELDGPGTIFILNTATGQEILAVTRGDLIYSISWKPDGSRIAGGIGYTANPISVRYVTIWDTSTGQVSNEIPFSSEDILSLDWSPDGSLIAAGGGDNNITIWDVNTGAVANTLVGHTYGVYSVSWSPDGSKLASSSSIGDRTIRIWDATTGQNILSIPSGAFDIAWRPDGTRIASPGLPSEVLNWDTSTGELLESIPHPNYVEAVAWSPDGSRLAIGDDSSTIRIIHFPTADVGADQTLTDTDQNASELVTLDGFGSSDADGTIVSYVWTENDVEIATGVNPQVTLAVGIHTITLTVTDDDGATDSDEVVITINPPATSSVLDDFNRSDGAVGANWSGDTADVVRVRNQLINEFTRQKIRLGTYSSNLIHDLISTGGMFNYDGFVKDGHSNIVGMNEGILSDNWRLGQDGDEPSTWGNKILDNQATTSTLLPEGLDYIFFKTDNCTYVAVITTLQGRFNATQLCN